MIIAVMVLLSAGITGQAVASDVMSISGAGATFPYPVYAKWADAYNKVTGIKLNYQSIGSGGGIKQIKAKTVDFGASDAPLKAEDLEQVWFIAVSHDHGRRGACGKYSGNFFRQFKNEQ